MSVILVTGTDGFIARNLRLRLAELGDHEVIGIGRADDAAALHEASARADLVFHLAGVNRPPDPAQFEAVNAGFTDALCAALVHHGRKTPIVYSSSTQAELDNPYGASKRAAETVLLRYAAQSGAAVHIYRLPNVFGKWARPNYNSAVATFCHNVARSEPLTVHDRAAALRLVYIDDVIDSFLGQIAASREDSGFHAVDPVYETTVGEVAEIILGFPESRETLVCPRVGTGLVRALYATYLTYLQPAEFDYSVPIHGDARGLFVEMLKTPDAGQFSYFTAGAGVTRGNHYHHSKAEKFLVISGTAHFAFRHMTTGETHEITTRGGEARVVETVPGWTHNITNIGPNELVVMLWANEIFDRSRPDTIPAKV
jgi:UDP-2-acetamido-2,6-beta-L-arabino-hexul-4-ose reductase